MFPVLDAAHVLVLVLDRQGRIVRFNRACERTTGYLAAEVSGQCYWDILMAPAEAPAASARFDPHKVRQFPDTFENYWVAKNGDRRLISWANTVLMDEANEVQYIVGNGIDITGRKQTEEMPSLPNQRALQQLQRADGRAVVLEAAGRVALDILSSRTGVEALRHIADAARTLAHARYAALGVAEPNGLGLLEFATVGMTPAQEAAVGARPRGAGVLGLLLQRTEPLRIDRLREHPASVGYPPNHPQMDSFLGVPIRRGDTVLGSLYLTNKDGGGPFTEEDEVAVQALSAYAAVAIYHLHMLSRQQALVSGLIAAQEEERRSVAYDLHDGLTQFVMASHAHFETFRRLHAAGSTERSARELDQGLKYLNEAVLESRRLVNGLRSLALDDLGLAGALEQLLTDEKTRAEWATVDLIHNIAGRRFDPTLETAVYRVAQEAVGNARKHADTPRIRVSLLIDPDENLGMDRLTLEVRDWGKGFDIQQKTGDYAHFGLHGMSERVHLLNGAYELQSVVGKGTTIRAIFPVLESTPP